MVFSLKNGKLQFAGSIDNLKHRAPRFDQLPLAQKMSKRGISDLLKSNSRRQYLGAAYLATEIGFTSKNTADALQC